jgi:Zn-dependent M16 (insulinase) family peptidase
MVSKFHKQNTDFQIAYFLAGSCHTPDAAYILLKELQEERQRAVDNYQVQKIKDKAKELRAKEKLNSKDEAERLEAEAELLELENNRKTGKVLYDAAVDEITFIDHAIAAIEPLRKYKDLPDEQVNELVQREEWLYELKERAENYMLTMGTIPADHLSTMRQHPDFKKELVPYIKTLRQALSAPDGTDKILTEGAKLPFQDNIIKLLK